MPLATDRDLLIFEPDLFRDAAFIGQRLVSATGAISGTTLTISAHDVDLVAAGVTAGHVALVDGAPYEVIERLSATTATISRLRGAKTDPAIPPSPVTGKPTTIHTFAPQIAMIEHQVLRMLGIEPSLTPEALGDPAAVTAASIKNPEALNRAVSLGTLHLVFAAAAAVSPPDSPHWVRADLYRGRYENERQHAAAMIDTDGDGIPDATRRLNAMQLIRG
jgi:hypothetical protein